MTQIASEERQKPRLYDGEGDLLLEADRRSDRVILMPSGDPRTAGESRQRIRIMWGHLMLTDLIDCKYRTVICGVNHEDNSHGILSQLLDIITTSQWSLKSATSYAKMFFDAVALHAADDREPYVLKYDLDQILILGILRPHGRDHLTLDDLAKGFRTISKMVETRRERWPVASVSFLGAKSNRLIGPTGHEPSFETVLRTMYEAGYRGDVYPSIGMWECAPTGVFTSYPFPDSLNRMRAGGF